MHGGTKDGRQRLARIGMFYMLRQLDLIDTPLPRMDQRYDAPDGSAAFFGITGRNLTTERLARTAAGEPLNGVDGVTVPEIIPAIPGLAASHRTEVMGWAINGVTATDATIYTVTAQDVSDGMPFTAGQKVCRVRPASGQTFGYADSIVYGYDRLPGYLAKEDYDNDVRAWMNWLTVDMGQADLERLPVQFQGDIFTLPTTLPAPAVFEVDGDDQFNSARISCQRR